MTFRQAQLETLLEIAVDAVVCGQAAEFHPDDRDGHLDYLNQRHLARLLRWRHDEALTANEIYYQHLFGG